MRPNYLKFAAHCSALGAAVGAIFTVFVTFMRDLQDMSFATTWDLFTHLAPWEWVAPGRWVLMVVGGAVSFTIPATLAFWFSESPRWNR